MLNLVELFEKATKSFRLLYWLVFTLSSIFVLKCFGFTNAWLTDAFSQDALLSFLFPWVMLLYDFALGYLLPFGALSFLLGFALKLSDGFLSSRHCPKFLYPIQDFLCFRLDDEGRPYLGFYGLIIVQFAEFLLLLFTSIVLFAELVDPGVMNAAPIPGFESISLVQAIAAIISIYCAYVVIIAIPRYRYLELSGRSKRS